MRTEGNGEPLRLVERERGSPRDGVREAEFVPNRLLEQGEMRKSIPHGEARAGQRSLTLRNSPVVRTMVRAAIRPTGGRSI